MPSSPRTLDSWPPVRGVIFDLDGTLVDSQLDFDAMRAEMQLEPGHSILEALQRLPEPRASHCRSILERHERAGADRAVPLPGVPELLASVAERGWRQAILTRNSREVSLATLAKLGIECDLLVAREDAPPKPDPAAIWQICAIWGATPREVIVIGDYRHDLEAGRRAGSRTVLYTGSRRPDAIPYRDLADFVVESFLELDPLWAWLTEST